MLQTERFHTMDAGEILHRHNLRRTGCREGILSAIMNAGQLLSENEIRDELDARYDRTTFYRSFKTLLASKIIHKVVIDNNLVKYAPGNAIDRKPNHAHFYCERCNRVLCMVFIPVGEPALPDGFKANDTAMVIRGLCSNCRTSKE